MGGARQARGIGVKEMLTDTINVICLLPQEVDGSLYCPFVPPTFSALALHGLRRVEEPRKPHGGRRGGEPSYPSGYDKSPSEQGFGIM